MGDVRVCTPRPDGLFIEEAAPGFALPSSNPHPLTIGKENWRAAEQTAERILRRIQPTKLADDKRREIVEHVRSLIRGVADVEIFPFGSVPLKTYLPDGDIDLTVISRPGSEDSLSKVVLAVLQEREQKGNSQLEIKDVQYINAEVKLVKCLVENILVDISFQKSGGLCSLCFLEKMDRMIGKDHLFKRSIILTKAWCYYESRILGAHHGLLSSYALEILVLYIFHAFPLLLDGPLSVLYTLLDFSGQFDWDNYGISLDGPVCLSSLPEIVVDASRTEEGVGLLSRDFLKKFEEEFSLILTASEGNSAARLFHKKHLNIIDPLKESNNLGRSVNKGSFHRIRSAFAYGARKLGRILGSPRERISEELDKFFTNSLDHCEESVSLSSSINSKPKSTARQVFYAPHEFFRLEEDEEREEEKPIGSPLLDLSGDIDTHWRNLHYVMSSLERRPSSPFFAVNSMNSNWVFCPSTFPPARIALSGFSPSRGTGTYIPNISRVYRERDQPGRRRAEAHSTEPAANSGETRKVICQRGPGQPVVVDQAASSAVPGLTRPSNSSSLTLEAATSPERGALPQEERTMKPSSYQLKDNFDFPPL